MPEHTATVTAGYGSTAVCRCNAILEVNADDREELVAMLNNKRHPHVRDLLNDSIFAGHAVLYVSLPSIPDDLCEVPHFGHDITCDPGTCDGPGVYRLFGVTLHLAAVTEKDVFGRYELTDDAQIAVCGKKRLTPGTTSRTVIERYA